MHGFLDFLLSFVVELLDLGHLLAIKDVFVADLLEELQQ